MTPEEFQAEIDEAFPEGVLVTVAPAYETPEHPDADTFVCPRPMVLGQVPSGWFILGLARIDANAGSQAFAPWEPYPMSVTAFITHNVDGRLYRFTPLLSEADKKRSMEARKGDPYVSPKAWGY